MGRGSSDCRLGGGKRFVWLGACLLPMSMALAQIAPAEDATQELLRQQERERALRQRQESKPDVRLERGVAAETGRLPADESPCFRIDRITLTGDAAERFQWALPAADPSDDPATGRCLGTAGINLVMKRVQNAIVARGYVTTRVLAAPQDLKQGTLALTLVPGRIRAIRFSDDSSPRATRWNALPAAPGDILNLRDIEQGLENFKRVPTADADIQIAPADGPGATPGESDLVIAWKQGLPFRLNVAADDSGSKYTGKYQGSVTVSYDHWWTLNDLFYASFNHDLGGGYSGSKGTRGYTVHYEVPYDYWLLGFTTSSYDYYQSVVGANQTYIYSGTSENSEVRLSRLFYRDAVRKTSAYVRGWVRSSANFIDDTEVEVQRRRMAGWEIGLNHREFIGAATLDANVAYRKGTGMLSSLPAPEESFDEGTARPSLITADAQLTVPFAVASQRLRYTTAWRGQWNRTPLVPQDRFSIGGRYTVRGFDGENTLIGDRGWLVRNDLGWTLGNSGQELYVGVDYGEVGGQSARVLIGQHLAGAVLGLRGGYKGLFWDVFIGTPLSKPEGFRTAHTTAGFNVSWSY
ncbi:ShlB/FhaC/HecB family hemolysin secretion/activation protein [Ralstonia pseudosolanacearum]|uniref:ShlB/FhaC/HecB family hemolysin secretion/activation protein n=1 Tax=Ralstonia pseudosolanacearum TaxID=1310165 RepID=UPI0008DAADE3|nr:ShlB/FhaC/HecB family hemolysin secretion/activation protein [Ralstonia pseudosolanacearum]MCL1622087.1 ShlB/FhaC/HecB family hemolysin secretion/activation protein [Ralstonia pseudosolanacearum CaRs-Mep]MCQ4678742.1 ShlB/FhaC/HecB family hemolysin secretion/activation protein [Ralstonia pseudosolanacearum]